jgi:pimeloyl-ACP methyl ester carboxylesterase
MPKALLNGVNIYYEENGQGFPVIFTHGYAGTTRSWDPQVAAFSRKCRFITHDMRGHGRTDAPADLARYTQDIVIEDIYQLLRHLGVKKAVVGGLSLGGYLTLHFYRQHPDMTAAIILMDTGPGYRTPEKAQGWNQTRIECAEVLETKGIKGFMESPYSRSDYYTSPEVMMKHNPTGLANVSRGVMINPWGVDILPDIKVPALILCGDRDTDFLPATDYMVEKIQGAKKAIIADAGHGSNIDQPGAFNTAVLEFLDGLKLGS